MRNETPAWRGARRSAYQDARLLRRPEVTEQLRDGSAHRVPRACVCMVAQARVSFLGGPRASAPWQTVKMPPCRASSIPTCTANSPFMQLSCSAMKTTIVNVPQSLGDLESLGVRTLLFLRAHSKRSRSASGAPYVVAPAALRYTPTAHAGHYTLTQVRGEAQCVLLMTPL